VSGADVLIISGRDTRVGASTVGSLGGDVTITAGQKYQQTGSDVLALAGDIDIQVRQVDITEARETRSSTDLHPYAIPIESRKLALNAN
jgi:hypothetical protein